MNIYQFLVGSGYPIIVRRTPYSLPNINVKFHVYIRYSYVYVGNVNVLTSKEDPIVGESLQKQNISYFKYLEKGSPHC